ncbi:MAG TPA: hypothetical protein VFD52_01895 [Clostridia bacterium]|nr:hypothetical protein [Clostridia bacterium]
MNACTDILANESEIKAHIQNLLAQDLQKAENFCVELILNNKDKMLHSRGVSSAYARCICTFLLDKKNKSRLVDVIKNNSIICTAFFGSLNTYKHSIVFVLKRIVRSNDVELLEQVLKLLSNNPFRDDNAKSYSDRWSLRFIIEQTKNAPGDYLKLSDESLKKLNLYLSE